MSNNAVKSSKRVLDPIERVSEVLFGLIMVLTFTGSLSVAEAGREDIRTMLVGALGCNLAWGIIDAVLYLMGSLAEKGTGLRKLRAVREAKDAAHGQGIIADALPPVVASVMRPDELESLRLRLMELPEFPKRAALSGREWVGAAGVFLLVFLITFPVAIPFLFMQDVHVALRTSNAIAVVLMFLCGVIFGRITGHNQWLLGISMVILGCVLVSLTMALGG